MRWIAGIALFVGGMAVSIGAPSDARQARQLADRGVDATATVTGVTIRRGGRGSRYAVVDVAFRDEFGLRAVASDVPYCEDPDSIRVGGTLIVKYDPEEVVPTRLVGCLGSQASTIPLIVGLVTLAAGTALIVWAWQRSAWRRRWIGVAIAILGILFVGTSFDDGGMYRELLYVGAALVIIGIVPLLAPRRRAPTPT